MSARVDAGSSKPPVKSPEPPNAPEPVKPVSKPEPKPDTKPDTAPAEDTKAGPEAGKDKGGSGGADAGKSASLIGKALTSVSGDAHDKHGDGPDKPTKDKPEGGKHDRPTLDVLGDLFAPGKDRIDNDGRADKIRAGRNVGERDERIGALAARKDDLTDAQLRAQAEVDAAKAAAKAHPGSAEAKQQLAEARDEYDALEDETATVSERLSRQRTLNAVAATAHKLGMPDEVADVIEGEGDVPLVVASTGELESEAKYDRKTDTIVVDPATIDAAHEDFRDLVEQGVMGGNGNVIDPEALDASTIGDDLVEQAAIVGHEHVHAEQDAAGRPLDEYEAYAEQEELELLAGKRKDGFLTTDLPAAQGAANVAAFQAGKPLPNGVSAGQQFGPASALAGYTEGAPGRFAPGRFAPGRFAPGQDAPGRFAPGRFAPGRFAPGRFAPGRFAPGRFAP